MTSASEQRAMCWVCGQWPTLTKRGQLRAHNYPGPDSIRHDPDLTGKCPGSGRSATVIQAPLSFEDVK